MGKELDDDSPFVANVRTLASLGIIVLVGAIASSSGVGGGAIFIPLLNALVGFNLKSSTSLSQACITCGAAATLLINLLHHHPDDPRVALVDFSLAAVLTPILLMGVGIGVMLNVMLPAWLLTGLLLLLLLLLITQSALKGRALWLQENALRARHQQLQNQQQQQQTKTTAMPPAAENKWAWNWEQQRRERRRYGGNGIDGDDSGGRAGLTEPLLGGGGGNGDDSPRPCLTPAPTAICRLADLGGDDKDGIEDAGERDSHHWACEYGSDGSGGGAARAAVVAVAARRSDGGDEPNRAAPPSAGVSGFAAAGLLFAALRSEGGSAMRSWRSALLVGAQHCQQRQAQALQPDTRHSCGGDAAAAAAQPTARDAPAGPSDVYDSGGDGASGCRTIGLHPPAELQSQLQRQVTHGSRGTWTPTAVPKSPFCRQSAPRSDKTEAGAAAAATAPTAFHKAPVVPQQSAGTAITGPEKATATAAAPSEAAAAAALAEALAAALVTTAAASNPGGTTWSTSWMAAATSVLTLLAAPSWRAFNELGAVDLDEHTAAHFAAPAAAEAEDGSHEDEEGCHHHYYYHTRYHGALQGGAARPAIYGSSGIDAADPAANYGDTDAAACQHSAVLQSVVVVDPGAAGDSSGAGGRSCSHEPLLPGRGLPRDPSGRPASHRHRAAAGTCMGTGAAAAATKLDGGEDNKKGLVCGGGGGGGGGALQDATAAAMPPLGTPERREGCRPPALSSPTLTGRFDHAQQQESVMKAAGEAEPLLQPPLGGQRELHAAVQLRDAAAVATGGAGSCSVRIIPVTAAPSQAASAAAGSPKRRSRRGGAAVQAAGGLMAALRRVPPSAVLALAVAWGVYFGLQLLRGWVARCSPFWWALATGQALGMTGLSVGALLAAAPPPQSAAATTTIATAAAATATRRASSFTAITSVTRTAVTSAEAAGAWSSSSSSSSVDWQRQQMALVLRAPVVVLGATCGAGLAGGLLGLGGGMVMGPLLLHLGVQPQVSAATSGAMVLFSSSAALAQFALLGRLNGPYAAAFGAVSAFASLAGSQLLSRAVRRSGRPSLVVMALTGVMAAGAGCVAAFGLRAALADVRGGGGGGAGGGRQGGLAALCGWE